MYKAIRSFLLLIILMLGCDYGKLEYSIFTIKNASELPVTIKLYRNDLLTDSIFILSDDSWSSRKLQSSGNSHDSFPEDVFSGDSASIIFEDGKYLTYYSGSNMGHGIFGDWNYERFIIEKRLTEYIYTIDENDYLNAQ